MVVGVVVVVRMVLMIGVALSHWPRVDTRELLKKRPTWNCISGCTEMAEECEHLRRHIWDQPYHASGDDDDDDADDNDDDEDDDNNDNDDYDDDAQ